MTIDSVLEADQHIPDVLESAAGGQELTLTKRGVPVAEVVEAAKLAEDQAERERKRQAALEWFRKGGLKGGVVLDWTRDELYDERFERTPWTPE